MDDQDVAVEKIEDWAAAKERTHLVSLISARGTLKFDVMPIPFGKMVEIEETSPLPDPPDKDSSMDQLQEYTLKKDNRDSLVATKVVDFCWKYNIPGDTAQDKQKWLLEKIRSIRDLNDLMEQIRRVSGWNRFDFTQSDQEVEATPDTWDTFNSDCVDAWFRYDFGNLHFKTYGISGNEIDRINKKTKFPEPPMKDFNVAKVGKKMQKKADYKDPKFVKECARLLHLRYALTIEKCLRMEIPGDDPDKVKWLRARPYWEVFHLQNFALKGTKSFSDYFDFFSNSSALDSYLGGAALL